MSEEKALDQLVREARRDLGPEGRDADGDWSPVDEALFARLATAPTPTERLHGERRTQAWWILGSFAAAAAVAVFVRPVGHEDSFERLSSATGTTHVASTLLSHEGPGSVRIDGAVSQEGRPLGVGDVIATEQARGVFVSSWGTRRGASWAIEPRTSLAVRRVPGGLHDQGEGPLVLALEHGAIEAQVVPVPRGEAFAVDVGSLRVAVHGTHLRVAREGSHVTVDLTEGVVSIGAPPRVGSTYGTLVTAPAHVTFDLDDRTHAVHVDKSPSAVRPPADLSGSANRAPEPSPKVGAPLVEAAEPAPDAPPPARAASTEPGAVAAPVHGSATPSHEVDPHPEASIRDAVASCTAPLLRSDGVRITVSSTLALRVGADGLVTFAQFDPPLAPEAQSCAAAAIYRTRFAHGGSRSIPIRVEK